MSVMLTLPPLLVGLDAGVATGRVNAEPGVVLPRDITVATSLDAPVSAPVDVTGGFFFPVAARITQNGTKSVEVSFVAAQGLVSTSGTLMARGPPLVELDVISRNPAWDIPGVVSSTTSRALDFVTVKVTSEGPLTVTYDGLRAISVGMCGTCTGTCGCWGLRGPGNNVLARQVRVGAVFDAGPTATVVPGMFADGGEALIDISRVQWRIALDGGVVAAPVVDLEGLFVGTASANQVEGRLFAFNRDGVALIGLPVQPVEAVMSLLYSQGPTSGIEDDVLYIAANGLDGGALRGVRLDGGLIEAIRLRNRTTSAMALANDNGDPTTIARFDPGSGSNGSIIQWSTLAPVGRTEQVLMDDQDVPGLGTRPRTNLVVSQDPARVAQTLTMVTGSLGNVNVSRREVRGSNQFAEFDGGTLYGPRLAPASRTPLVLQSAAQPGRDETWVVGAGSLWWVPDGGSFGGMTPSPPVVDRAGATWFSNGTAIVMTRPGGATRTVPFMGTVEATPLLGERLGRFDFAYFVTTDGRLAVVRAPPPSADGGVSDDGGTTLELAWTAALPFSPNATVTASLAFRCDTSNTTPPQLFVASEQGEVLSIIVDSTRIDTLAVWPKYQHDSQNSGNPSTPTCR